MWLLDDGIPESLKPSRSGIVFTGSKDRQRMVAYLTWDKHLDSADDPAILHLFQLAKEWPETFAVQGDYISRVWPDGGMETRLHGTGWGR